MTINKNLKIYLYSEFFFNIARTFPHAVLTIFLVSQGISLSEIAILQILYMIAIIILEVPSGILNDYWSRKKMYIISTVLLLISYTLIYFSNGKFGFLAISWLLYGTSSAFKSGTLDSEVVLEIREQSLDMKKFSTLETYLSSIAAILGAFIGSILYVRLANKIYLFAISLFLVSIFVALSYKPLKSVKHNFTDRSIIKEIQNGFKLFVTDNKLRVIILLFCLIPLFIQPLFQFWQVLYEYKDISVIYFGYVYAILQICNILGSLIYRHITYKYYYSYILLLLIPIIFIFQAIFFENLSFFISFPIVVTLFYIYLQFANVYMRENSPKEYISTFTSTVGTALNLFSIVSLVIISILLKYLNIVYIYILMFLLFSILSILILRYNKKI